MASTAMPGARPLCEIEEGGPLVTKRPERKRPVTSSRTRVTRGTDNVYADVGFERPDEEIAKAQLAVLIDEAIRQMNLTQQAAASLMAIDQPKVSHILRGRLGDFSTQRLMEFLNALGRDIEIVVRWAPPSRKRGRLLIAAA
jgi:predicted XRE-type DNA-binding protein